MKQYTKSSEAPDTAPKCSIRVKSTYSKHFGGQPVNLYYFFATPVVAGILSPPPPHPPYSTPSPHTERECTRAFCGGCPGLMGVAPAEAQTGPRPDCTAHPQRDDVWSHWRKPAGNGPSAMHRIKPKNPGNAGRGAPLILPSTGIRGELRPASFSLSRTRWPIRSSGHFPMAARSS